MASQREIKYQISKCKMTKQKPRMGLEEAAEQLFTRHREGRQPRGDLNLSF
jgi:hypothetical protein